MHISAARATGGEAPHHCPPSQLTAPAERRELGRVEPEVPLADVVLRWVVMRLGEGLG